MLNKNETMHRFPYRHHKNKKNENSEASKTEHKSRFPHPPPPFGMYRSEFHKFVKTVFGKSGLFSNFFIKYYTNNKFKYYKV